MASYFLEPFVETHLVKLPFFLYERTFFFLPSDHTKIRHATVGVNLLLPLKSRIRISILPRDERVHIRKSGEQREEDGFEGGERRRRTNGVVFEDSDEEDGLEANQNLIRKEDEEEGVEEGEEEITVREGAKRKIGHECDVCEKVFRYPSGLARHMRTHTKEKPICVMFAGSVLVNPVL